MNHSRTRRMPALALAAAVTIIGLAACGSSSSTSSASSSASAAAATGSSAARTKLTACLKAHGVTLPTRPAGTRPAGAGAYGAPGAGGAPGGFFGGGGAGARGRFSNPKFQAAFRACGGTAFRGGAFRRRFTFSHAAVDKFVTCVRQHGYDLPAPNFSGTGPIFPAKIEANAKFQTASRACASDLRPAGAGTGAGSGAGSGTTSTATTSA